MTFDHLLFTAHPRMGGMRQASYRFPNGYGISVITGPGAYGGGDGLYEIGILLNENLVYGLKMRNRVGQLFEVDDVIGYLTPEDVTHYMNEIASLPGSEEDSDPKVLRALILKLEAELGKSQDRIERLLHVIDSIKNIASSEVKE